MTPAVRYLRYELTNSGNPGTETSHYIDLAKDLSRLNRRLYRQGRDYHVKRISVVSSNTIAATNVYDQTAFPGATTQTQNAGRITFSTVPNSWHARAAWRRGFALWQAHIKKAMSGVSGDLRPKYHDFKVYLSNDMRSGTMPQPLDNGGGAANSGDWDYSKIVSPDGTTGADEFYLHMLGDHAGPGAGSWLSVGLIESFGDSRATVDSDQPNVPNAASDDPLVNAMDDGTVTDEIIQDLEGDNDSAPYGIANYSGGGANHPKPLVVQQTTLGADGRATVGGFQAMCGLLEIETTSPIANDVYSVLVELAPGNYRGIAAEVI